MGDLQIDLAGEEEPSAFIDGIEDIENDRRAIEGTDEFGRSIELLKWKPVSLRNIDAKGREARYELFRRGDISWLLHPEQLKLVNWLDAKHRELTTICASRQWGKTMTLLAYAFSYAIKNPRTATLFVSPFRTQADNTLLGKINIVFQFLPADLIPLRRGATWIFPNGSTFRIDGVAVGKGARSRGDTLNLCIIDECRDIPDLQGTIESVIAPMFTTTDGRLILISTPPESPLHPFTKKYIQEAQTTGDFYSLTYKQNPLLSAKRLRYLINVLHKGGEDNIIFRREYMADYSQTDPEKRVVREWDEAANDKFFVEYKGPPKVVRPYVGLDYGFNDPAGIVVGYYDFEAGCLIIEEEWFARGKNSDEVGMQIVAMEQRLKERIPGALEPIRVMDIDPSLTADLYNRFKLRFEPSLKVPSAVTMLNRLRVSFLEGKIRIKRSCPQLRFQLQAGIFNASGSDYVRTQFSGHLDLIDAIKYLNLNLRWNELTVDPRPKYGEALGPNQMRIGGFASHGSFREGVLHRPT